MTREKGEVQADRDEQLVIFRLAEEHYGVDIAGVREIITWQPVTRMPKAPAFMEGVLNLRGNVIPVVDLRKRFEFPELAHGNETRIIVVEICGQVVGLVVDAVTEVLQVSARSIEPAQGLAVNVNATFVRGVAKVGQRLIVLLDLDELLEARERAAILTQVEERTAPASGAAGAVA